MFAQRNELNYRNIVFIFFTLLYRAKTLGAACRINHKSPVSGQFHQIFT